MSSSQSLLKHKFLLDENVKRRLEIFLKSKGFDVILAPRGVSNGRLAMLSKSEKRILVTNDSDFTDPVLFPKEKIFSIIWLRIPQYKSEALLNAFSLLLKEIKDDFEGNLGILNDGGFEIFIIP